MKSHSRLHIICTSEDKKIEGVFGCLTPLRIANLLKKELGRKNN